MNEILKKAEKRIRIIDTKQKMIFLIICVAFFDFIQFVISVNTPKFINVSRSFSTRLRSLFLIFDAIFYYFVLKLPIMRHQVFYLIIIGFCLIIILITEFIFQEINIFLPYGKFIFVIFLSFNGHFLCGLIDSNEKYLFEYDNMNQFYVLSFEGLFGFLFTLVFDIFYNPFEIIKELKRNNSSSEFVILIFCLIIFIILSALKNLFRVYSTKIFTSMATTSVEYILNPIYFIV
jgi:hypothetical protein